MNRGFIYAIIFSVLGLTITINGEEIDISSSITITAPEYAAVDKSVSMSASSSCDIEEGGTIALTYTWDFDDESGEATGKDQTHTYTEVSGSIGDKTVRVTVRGEDEDNTYTGTTTTQLTVFEAKIATPVPADFPKYAGVNNSVGYPLQGGTNPDGISAGVYDWEIGTASGDGYFTITASTDRITSFVGTEPGDVYIRVKYTVGSQVDESEYALMKVFKVDITTPATFPVWVAISQTEGLGAQVTPTLSISFTYYWTVAGNATGSICSPDGTAEAINTTFTAGSTFGESKVKVEARPSPNDGVSAYSEEKIIKVYDIEIKAQDGQGTPNKYIAYQGTEYYKGVYKTKDSSGNTIYAQSGPSGSWLWSEQSPKVSLQNQTTQTVTVNGDTVSASVDDVTIEAEFTPTGESALPKKQHTLTVFGIRITSPTVYPQYVGKITPLTMSSIVDPSGVTGGTYLWGKASGTGAGTFSPQSASSSFTGQTAGSLDVNVKYTISGQTATSISKNLVVYDVTVALASSWLGIGHTMNLTATLNPAIPASENTTFLWEVTTTGKGTGTFSPNNTTDANNTVFTASTTEIGIAYIKVTATPTNGTQGKSSENPVRIYEPEIKAENGTSDPSEYIGKDNTEKYKCVYKTKADNGVITYEQSGPTGSWSWTKSPSGTTKLALQGTDQQIVTARGVEASASENDLSIGMVFDPAGSEPAFSQKTHSLTVFAIDEITSRLNVAAVGGDSLPLTARLLPENVNLPSPRYKWTKENGQGECTFSPNNTNKKSTKLTATKKGTITVKAEVSITNGQKTSKTKDLTLVEVELRWYPGNVTENSSKPIDPYKVGDNIIIKPVWIGSVTNSSAEQGGPPGEIWLKAHIDPLVTLNDSEYKWTGGKAGIKTSVSLGDLANNLYTTTSTELNCLGVKRKALIVFGDYGNTSLAWFWFEHPLVTTQCLRAWAKARDEYGAAHNDRPDAERHAYANALSVSYIEDITLLPNYKQEVQRSVSLASEFANAYERDVDWRGPRNENAMDLVNNNKGRIIASGLLLQDKSVSDETILNRVVSWSTMGYLFILNDFGNKDGLALIQNSNQNEDAGYCNQQ